MIAVAVTTVSVVEKPTLLCVSRIPSSRQVASDPGLAPRSLGDGHVMTLHPRGNRSELPSRCAAAATAAATTWTVAEGADERRLIWMIMAMVNEESEMRVHSIRSSTV